MAPSKPQTRFAFYTALTQCGGPQNVAVSPDSSAERRMSSAAASSARRPPDSASSAAAASASAAKSGDGSGDDDDDGHVDVAVGGAEGFEATLPPILADDRDLPDPRTLLLGRGAADILSNLAAMEKESAGGRFGAGAAVGVARRGGGPAGTPVHRNRNPTLVSQEKPVVVVPAAATATPTTSTTLAGTLSMNGAQHQLRPPVGDHVAADERRKQPALPAAPVATAAAAAAASLAAMGDAGDDNPFQEALEEALRSLRQRRADRQRHVGRQQMDADVDEDDQESEREDDTCDNTAMDDSFKDTEEDEKAGEGDGDAGTGVDLLAAKQEEWAARRERMDAYASRLEEFKDRMRREGEFGDDDDDFPRVARRPPRPEDGRGGAGSAGLFVVPRSDPSFENGGAGPGLGPGLGVVPTPAPLRLSSSERLSLAYGADGLPAPKGTSLHPPVAPASVVDSILLSPSVDVRKAFASSSRTSAVTAADRTGGGGRGGAGNANGNGGDPAVFRPPHTPGTARAVALQPGLERSLPLRSESDLAATPARDDGSAASAIAVADGGVGFPSKRGAALDQSVPPPPPLASPPAMRRSPTPTSTGGRRRDHAVEGFRGRENRTVARREYEEAVERGVEAVLLAILGRASSRFMSTSGTGVGALEDASAMEATVEAALASVSGRMATVEGNDDESCSDGDASGSLRSSLTGSGSFSLRQAGGGGAGGGWHRGRPSRPPPRRIGHERDDAEDADRDANNGCNDAGNFVARDAVIANRPSYEADVSRKTASTVDELLAEASDEDDIFLRDSDGDHDGDRRDDGSSLRTNSVAEDILSAQLSPLNTGEEDDGVNEDEVGEDNPVLPALLPLDKKESTGEFKWMRRLRDEDATPVVTNKVSFPQSSEASESSAGLRGVLGMESSSANAQTATLGPCVVEDATPEFSDEGMVGVEASIRLGNIGRERGSYSSDDNRQVGNASSDDDGSDHITDDDDSGDDEDSDDDGDSGDDDDDDDDEDSGDDDDSGEDEEEDDISDEADDVEIDSSSLENGMISMMPASYRVHQRHTIGVLGPLSKKMGGTTGIVLTDDDTEEEDASEVNEDDKATGNEGRTASDVQGGRHQQVLSPQQQRNLAQQLHHPTPPGTAQFPLTESRTLPASPSLFQSLSDTFLATMGNVSPFASREMRLSHVVPDMIANREGPRRDGHVIVSGTVPGANALPTSLELKDVEAAALVRVLCGHLLPNGLDRILDDILDKNKGGKEKGRGDSRLISPSSSAPHPSSASISSSLSRVNSSDITGLRDAVGAVGSWFGVQSGSDDDTEGEEDLDDSAKVGPASHFTNVSKSTSKGDGIGESVRRRRRPEWDESDPDEPGYVTHVLTRAELRRVEAEFERIVSWVRGINERDRLRYGLNVGQVDSAQPRHELMSHPGANVCDDDLSLQKAEKKRSLKDDDETHDSRNQECDGEDEGEEVVNVEDNDEGFKRDLEEAERLLEGEEEPMEVGREEKRKASEMGLAKKTRVVVDGGINSGDCADGGKEKKVFIDDDEGEEEEEEDDDDENEDDDDDDSDSSECSSSVESSNFAGVVESAEVEQKNQDLLEVTTGSNTAEPRSVVNPDFPLMFAAGKGRLGDLELFHLPIVYKSHQTGFEPTKDLVLAPGSVFAGQYLVQNELGSAAFSTAYRCIDLQSGKIDEDGEEYHEEVCLKVIKNTKDFFDQSLDEIKVLELLRQTGQCHENNIVEMKTFFYHREHLVIVTELLRQNLYEFGKFIAENDEPPYFTRRRLCYITQQILIALRFIHCRGLVHSDVKPENILLASYSRARVKLIDFGSSCYLTDRQSSYIQSRSYRAPEVVLGLPYDGKIDVWSLGCVVAEMYTGEVTFQNDSVVTMLSRIETICGAFPQHLITSGRQSGHFFTVSGLLYERAGASGEEVDGDDSARHSDLDLDNDNGGDEVQFHVFQPKVTTLAARLGFDADLMERPPRNEEEEEKVLFVDFVRSLLTIDPEHRPSADEALHHPWIQSFGVNPSERDIKYPPED